MIRSRESLDSEAVKERDEIKDSIRLLMSDCIRRGVPSDEGAAAHLAVIYTFQRILDLIEETPQTK